MQFFSYLLIIFLTTFQVRASADGWSTARNAALKLEWKLAIEALNTVEVKTPSDQALKAFAEGLWWAELAQYQKSSDRIAHALKLHSGLAVYGHYQLGKNALALGQIDTARQEFEKLIKLKPTPNIRNEATFELSRIEIQRARPQVARSHLTYLERRMRSDPLHPEILWRLLKLEKQAGRRWQMCKWAKTLYSSYPAHPLVHDWTVDLAEAKLDGDKMGCLAQTPDMRRRLRRLQLGGKAEQAEAELELLLSRAAPTTRLALDLLAAQTWAANGDVGRAFEQLLPHYEKHRSDPEFLNVFAQIAAKAGEYQVAVGAYYQNYKLQKKNRHGRSSLFSAAFLSYQFQDYDGAARRFQELLANYDHSGLVRDSKWHMAWLRYLKADYRGAIADLSEILKAQKSRARLWRQFPDDKIRYWIGMSHLRLGEMEAAHRYFSSLQSDSLKGFYAILAESRLRQLPPLANRSVAAESPVGDRVRSSAEEETNETKAITITEETESEENLKQIMVTQTDEDAKSSQATLDDETEVATAFSSPELQKHFDTALQLIRLGRYDWARWELYSIEQRTRNRDYLRRLMKHYEEIEAFNRSTYIATIYFSDQRGEYGISGAQYLWRHSYPTAYHNYVQQYSKGFGISPEWVWSVMRAESMFKYDVSSPVGARGLMQIMPYTAERVARLLGEVSFVENDLINPEVNIRLGSRYLQRLAKKFEGALPLVAAAYNAGPHRVETWLNTFGHLDLDEFIEHIPFVETRNYVKKVMRNYYIYAQLNGHDGDLAQVFSQLTKVAPVQFSGPSPTRESWDPI